MLRVVLCVASVIVFAGLCTAKDGGRPDCRSTAMTGPLNKDDYEEDTPGMPPPPPPTGILQNASILGPGVSDVCPQLRGQAQCCSADYFSSAENRLRGQTLLTGFSKQGQSRLDLFNSVARGIVDSESPGPSGGVGGDGDGSDDVSDDDVDVEANDDDDDGDDRHSGKLKAPKSLTSGTRESSQNTRESPDDLRESPSLDVVQRASSVHTPVVVSPVKASSSSSSSSHTSPKAKPTAAPLVPWLPPVTTSPHPDHTPTPPSIHRTAGKVHRNVGGTSLQPQARDPGTLGVKDTPVRTGGKTDGTREARKRVKEEEEEDDDDDDVAGDSGEEETRGGHGGKVKLHMHPTEDWERGEVIKASPLCDEEGWPFDLPKVADESNSSAWEVLSSLEEDEELSVGEEPLPPIPQVQAKATPAVESEPLSLVVRVNRKLLVKQKPAIPPAPPLQPTNVGHVPLRPGSSLVRLGEEELGSLVVSINKRLLEGRKASSPVHQRGMEERPSVVLVKSEKKTTKPSRKRELDVSEIGLFGKEPKKIKVHPSTKLLLWVFIRWRRHTTYSCLPRTTSQRTTSQRTTSQRT
eukprot:Em0014g23a